jgi:hypothetical protein
MNARRRTMESPLLGPDLDKMWPLIPHGQSDTASLDNALELLVAGGYPLAQAVMMLIPEAWAGNPLMDDKRRAFYEYHAALMEPWDGPAAIAFTDGRQIADHRFDVASHIAHFGELAGFHFQKRRIGQLRQPPRQFRFAHAGRPNHQDVLGHDLFRHFRVELLAADAVAQSNGDGLLGVALPDDIFI